MMTKVITVPSAEGSVAVQGIRHQETLAPRKFDRENKLSIVCGTLMSAMAGMVPVAIVDVSTGMNTIPAVEALTVSSLIAGVLGVIGCIAQENRDNAEADINETFGPGTSSEYKMMKFRRTFKEERTSLPFRTGSESTAGAMLVELNLVTNIRGHHLEFVTKEEPMDVWDKHISTVRKLYKIQPATKMIKTRQGWA